MSSDNNDPHPLLHADDLSSVIPLSHHDSLPSADSDMHDASGPPSLDVVPPSSISHPSDLPLPHSHAHNQMTSDHHVSDQHGLPSDPHPLSSVHDDHSGHLPLPHHDPSNEHQPLPVPVPDQHGDLQPVHDGDQHAPLGGPDGPPLTHPSLPLPGDHVGSNVPPPPLSGDHVGDQHVPLSDQHGGLPVHVVTDSDMTGPGGGGLHDEHDHAMALHMSDYGLHSGMLDGDQDDPDHDMHMTIPDEYADVSIKDIQRAREKATQRPVKPTRRRKRGPKASQSAFAFFRFEILGEICEQHPDASPDAIMNMVEQKWSMLTEHEKQQYQVKANEDESRYSEEVKLYLPKSQGGVMKRKKAKKHPQAPKHPMSAYLYFVADHRQKLKAMHPDKGFTDIARMLGEQWRKLDAASRAAYEQRASLDKERYKGEKDNFQPTPVDENKDAKRKKKHPLAPKHPLSAYLFFVATNRPKMNAEHPDKDFTEVAQMLGNMWKNLPAHQKKKYEILAFADKKRYLEEKEKWTPPIEKAPPAPKKAADGTTMAGGMAPGPMPPPPVQKERSRSPTRSKAAYNLWVVDNRHDLPPNLDPKQADKILRQRWKNTADEYRAPYFELAEKTPPMHYIPQARMDPQAMHKPPHPSAMMPPPPPHMHVMPPGMASPNVAPVQPPSAVGAGGADPKKRGRPRKYQATSEVLSWNSHEIGRFIASLGLGEHKDKFVRSGITGEQFINLSSPQLRDNFMIANIGDRKKIIKGIQNLTK